jgi:hypothetical protein
LVSLTPEKERVPREREKERKRERVELTTGSRRGGFVVWRAAQWYPDLVSHVFSVCSTSPPFFFPPIPVAFPLLTPTAPAAPYTPPHAQYFSTEQLAAGPLPQFKYQVHLASGEVEKSVHDAASIRQFLKGVYGARGPEGELVFDPEKGVLVENLGKVGESRILNGEVSGSRLC